MKIVIASGKGGTGKTTISTNLAYTEAQKGRRAVYVDCDVEEPNGHLFLKPEIENTKPVGAMVPAVDRSQCSLCGQCGEICVYNAIVCIKKEVLVFPEMCHSCGGCCLVCPEGAITQSMKTMGRVETGRSGDVQFVQGILNIGEAMSPPIIRAVKNSIPESDLTILDAPPGTSCPVIETIKGGDFIVLVTEPTPFGLHDLTLAIEMVRALNYLFGVVINRADLGNTEVKEYCRKQNIPVLAEIDDDRRVAEAYSRGSLACQSVPEYARIFSQILERIESELESVKVSVS